MAEYKLLKKATSRQEWLKLRQMGIGGSDAGAIMGLNIHKKRYDVFRDKMSHHLREFSNAAMRFGTVFEPYILDRIRQHYPDAHVQSGDSLGTLHHLERIWQIANIDGMLVRDEQPLGVGLEVKTCAHSRHHYWHHSVPKMYYAQVQHYMSVMGWDKFDIWLCVVMGDRKNILQGYDNAPDQEGFAHDVLSKCLIERHEVPRDIDFINKMNDAERSFWDLVSSARQHDPYFKKDSTTSTEISPILQDI